MNYELHLTTVMNYEFHCCCAW